MTKDRLIYLRKEKQKLQTDIAAYLSCSLSTVSGYENGKPVPMDVIVKLADYYDVSADYLLCRTSERKSFTGDLPEMLHKLSTVMEAPFLTAADIAALITAMARYYTNDKSIGEQPADIVRDFILGMTGVFNAIAERNVPMLIDQCDATLVSALEVAKIIPQYFQFVNLFEPKQKGDT